MRERDEIVRRERVRQLRVRQLFEARLVARRTETEVTIFLGWLLQHHPELLSRKAGNQYLHLMADLKGLYHQG